MNKISSIIMMLIAAVAFTACSSNEGIGEGNETDPITKSPSTKVLVNGSAASVTFSSAFLEESVVPAEQNKTYFFIRIDGMVPTLGDAYSDQYFPAKSNGKTLTCDQNMGLADNNAPWRKLAGKFDKYLYATDGIAVEGALSNIPTIEDLLNANQYKGNNNELVQYFEELRTKLAEDPDAYHVIWYAAKYQNADKSWHVDGILTTKNVTTVEETDFKEDLENKQNGRIDDKVVESDGDGEVEVDIHQQEHQNWDEIKTSIHIRENANVRVTIPIGKEFVEEADDFAIRTYEVFIPGVTDVTDVNGAKIKVTVKHTTDNIVIEVTGVTKEIIDQLEAASEDGLTIEVHNYIKDLSDVDIQEAIKYSKVETFKPETGADSDKLRAPLNTYIYGQITTVIDKNDITPIGGKDQKRHMADKDNVAPAATETEN